MTGDNPLEVQRSLGRIEGGIDEIKGEIKNIRLDHAGLRAEFNKLEAGRLTRLESEFAVSKAEIHARAGSTARWVAAFTAIIVSVITAGIVHFLHI